MVSGTENTRIRSAIDALRAQGIASDLAEHMAPAADAVATALQQAVLDEVPAYSDSGNPEIVPELQAHISALTDAILGMLGGQQPSDFDPIRAHAERRAGQRFPLEALLHTYRLAHKTLFPWIRDAALECAPESAHVRRVVAATADFAIEYFDTVSTLATSSYVSHTRALAEAESDQRTELLNTLLQGYDESDSRAAQLLRRAGYLKQRQSYCVVAARSVNPGEMESAARAQRMADAIGDVLAPTPLRTLIGVRDNLVITIVSATRRLSGWTAPQSLLADRLIPQLRLVGPAAFIGMSNDVPSTSYIPRAAAEARLALDFATFTDRVMPYSSISLRQLLVAQARDSMQASLPGWLDDFVDADRRARGRLRETLSAYADADMNVLQAAKQLSVHPNTVYARAQKIGDITGKSLLNYHDLTELLLAMECHVDR